MNQIERYLRYTPTIDCDSASIKDKAQDLTSDCEGVRAKAKSIFYFVRDEIRYNPYVMSDRLEYYKASETLKRGKGYCVQKAVLLAALARSADIPTRLHFVALRNHLIPDKLKELMGTNLFAAHGYNELYIDGKWVKATPAFDLKMCQKNRIIPVDFDGENDALFSANNLDGELHIEYVEDYGDYDDLPFDMIMNLRIQVLGADFFERLKQSIEKRKAQN